MTLDAVLADGFSHHAAEPERLARELEAASLDGAGAATLVELLRVGNHTIGEHLGDWPRARRLAERALDGHRPTAETAKAWAHLSIARLLDGAPAAALAAELAFIQARGGEVCPPMIEARFMLVAALVGSARAPEAAAVYAAALDLAQALGEAAPHRAVAVASNNLASELMEQPTRTPEEDALMVRAAEASHAFWLKCGDWKHDERGLYLKALVANVRGRPDEALSHVDAALAIIAANGEAPVDHTFLHLTAAHAHKLRGDAEAQARMLAVSDAAAAAWDDEGLRDWYDEERGRTQVG
jgi:tetratricopeptide (TPR) repeat protein